MGEKEDFDIVRRQDVIISAAVAPVCDSRQQPIPEGVLGGGVEIVD